MSWLKNRENRSSPCGIYLTQSICLLSRNKFKKIVLIFYVCPSSEGEWLGLLRRLAKYFIFSLITLVLLSYKHRTIISNQSLNHQSKW